MERWTRRLDGLGVAVLAAATLQLLSAGALFADRADLPGRLWAAASMASTGGVLVLLALLLVSVPEFVVGQARDRTGRFGFVVRQAALLAVVQVGAGVAALLADNPNGSSTTDVLSRLGSLVLAAAALWWAVTLLTDARFVPRLGRLAPKEDAIQPAVTDAEEPT